MLIFFNWIGIGMVILGVFLGYIANTFIGGNIGILVAGLAMAITDFIYRNKRKAPYENTPFFHPKRGGNIMFVPVWIVGIIVVVIGLSK